MDALAPFEEINRNSPKQREEGWLSVRRNSVNASELGGLTGVSHYSVPKTIIRNKVLLSETDTYPSIKTDAMQWGSKFEAVSRYLVERAYRVKVIDCASYEHPLYPFIRGSPDGLFLLDGNLFTCEFKTPYNRTPTRFGPSEEYMQQIQTVLDICINIAKKAEIPNPIVGCKFLDLCIRRCSLGQLRYPREANRHTYREAYTRYDEGTTFPHVLMFYVDDESKECTEPLIDFGTVAEQDLTYNSNYEVKFAAEWSYEDVFGGKEYPQIEDAARTLVPELRTKYGNHVAGFICFKVFQANFETILPDSEYWTREVLPSAVKYGTLLRQIISTPDFAERRGLFEAEFGDQSEALV